MVPAGCSAPSGPVTVLIADDEPRVLDSARRILESAGYRVLLASSLPEAVAAARVAPSIEVLITDMVMPDHSGGEVAAGVCGLHPEVAVIFMSGYTEDAIGCGGTLGPRQRFLTKPFRLRTLLDTVSELLAEEARPPG